MEYAASVSSTSPGSMDCGLGIGEVLKLIPESMAVPLVLKHVEGFSYEEIAGVLGIRVSAAKMRVKRGRDQLVDLLYPELEGERR